MVRAEGLDPDDPVVVAAIDVVRWELSRMLGFQRWKVTIASRCADASAAVAGYVNPFIPFLASNSLSTAFPPLPPSDTPYRMIQFAVNPFKP